MASEISSNLKHSVIILQIVCHIVYIAFVGFAINLSFRNDFELITSTLDSFEIRKKIRTPSVLKGDFLIPSGKVSQFNVVNGYFGFHVLFSGSC